MITQKDWMDAGYSYAAIAAEADRDWRTVKKYLEAVPGKSPSYAPRPPRASSSTPSPASSTPGFGPRSRSKPKRSTNGVVDDPDHFPGSYQRVKEYVWIRRPEIEAELGIEATAPMRRGFETIAGAQAQVDWGDEGTIVTPRGELPVHSSTWC